MSQLQVILPTAMAQADYKVLGLDDELYGPVEMSQLVEWAQDERILADSWLLSLTNRTWMLAAEVQELKPYFAHLQASAKALPAELQPDSLRRVRAFSELSLDQLARLTEFVDLQHIPAGTVVTRTGTIGDFILFLLSGRVRLKISLKSRELTINQIEPGGVFGQISLFDKGPRVTDAIAESDITCVRITDFDFRRLCQSAPDLAVPIVLGLGKSLATRIRNDDKHLCEIAAMQSAMG